MRAKIVLMSSLDGGVGKTTLSAVLSVAKGYVLMVDADWEKAELSVLFRAPRKAGWLAPFLDGKMPYIHRLNPMLYLMPGYEAVELYHRHGAEAVGDFEEALLEWIAYMPKLLARLRLPVDTVVVDTPAALRLDWLARAAKAGAYVIFVADRRLIARISDVKAEQYSRYMAYASVAVVNQVLKEELGIARKLAPVAIRHVGPIRDYSGEAVANAIVRDRHNRKAVEDLLARIKTS